MRRPEYPSGDVHRTQILRVVTGSTEVVRRLREEEDLPAPTPRFLNLLSRASVVCVCAGSGTVVVAFAIRPVVELSVPLLILGFLLLAGGMSVATLEAFLAPDRPELDQRLVAFLRRLVRR